MFINICKARVKVLIREKNFVFWGLVFPIFLATFLYIETVTPIAERPEAQNQAVAISENITIERSFLDQDGRLDGIIYFLGIVAIACIISGFIGCREIEDSLCYISSKAVRVNIAPMSFWLFFICSLCVTWGISNVYLMIILIYFKTILGIQIQGPFWGWMMMICLSTLCGGLLSMLIGTTSRQSIPIKQGIIAIIGVGGCILAGLVNEDVKFYIDAYYPIITKLNPTSMMVDGMLTLCTEGMSKQFYEAITHLSIFNGICLILLIIMIKRRRNG